MTDVDVTSPRVILVETSDALPGLLPFQAWDALATADQILVREGQTHPSSLHLYGAGLDLIDLQPATLDRGDLDLTRPGAPEDRRLAKALLAHALDGQAPVFLLGPGDEGLAPALAGMAAEHDLEIELVFFAPQPEGTELLRLVEVMRRLRDPNDGCPWDLKQDHSTLVAYLLEETYELVDALESEHDADIIEELGDVLLQIVFHARIGSDRRAFSIDDVARGIADKLTSRHPHVFADGTAETAEDVQANWDELKAVEKQRLGPFDGVPSSMAGLMILDALRGKAAKRGLVLSHQDPAAELRERLAELLAAEDHDAREVAVGELLHAAVRLSADNEVDAEAAARRAARTFRARAEQALHLAARRETDEGPLSADAWREVWAEVLAQE